MNIFYFYFLMLLLVLLLLYRGLNYSFAYAPIKIKVITVIELTLLGLRYVSLIFFLLCNSIKYLYLFKPLAFLNLLCVPSLAMVSLYILARKDKIKFNYCIIGSSIILFLYLIIAAKLPIQVEIYRNLGYRMVFLDSNIIEYVYLSINSLFFFSSLLLLGESNIKKAGIWLVFFSSLITMLEIIIKLLGITILPVLFIGDILWIVTVDYALSRLKK